MSGKQLKLHDSATIIENDDEVLASPSLRGKARFASAEKIPTPPRQSSSHENRKLRFGSGEDEDGYYAKKKTFAAEMEQAAMMLVQRACPITCQRFLKVEDFAEIFVDEIIEEATNRTIGIQELSAIKIVDGVEYKDQETDSSHQSVATYVCVLEWPTIDEFTVELGQNKILEFVSYWKFREDWKYSILYLKGESDQTCDFHYYEVMFSIPSKQYPIPQATASVYFTMELSRVRPKHCLVDIDFCFEGQRFRHKPGNFKFQEIFLFNIIDAKISFYKTLTF